MERNAAASLKMGSESAEQRRTPVPIHIPARATTTETYIAIVMKHEGEPRPVDFVRIPPRRSALPRTMVRGWLGWWTRREKLQRRR
jgi:hypothetical protein